MIGVVHRCHAPGCERPLMPRLFACREHWFAIPLDMREAIKREYRPGQERDKNPSRAYVMAALAARRWLLERGMLP